MERLIHSSSSCLLSKPHLKLPHHSPFRLPRTDALPFGLSLPRRPDFVHFLSGFSALDNSTPSSSSSLSYSSYSSSFRRPEVRAHCSNKGPPFSSSPDPDASSTPRSHFLERTVETSKKKFITAGAVLLASALFVLLGHPIIASSAYAAGFSAASAVNGKIVSTELLTSAWTGFFAGCLHTLSGPDHLAALAPLSIGRTRVESALVGALWGCGHDAGQVIFGLLFVLLKDRLHIEILRTWGTRVVGFTLLLIGAMGIREASESPAPCVVLENGECDVSMYDPPETPAVGKKKIGLATFATGIVHGLQPDALVVVLPALALPSRVAGAIFLGMFLIGTVVAMGSYTVFIGSCSEALKGRVPRVTEKLTWASSVVAIALGLAIIVSQFFGFNLY